MDETGAKITELTSIAGADVAGSDLLTLVDISDTTMATSGTNKKITINELRKIERDYIRATSSATATTSSSAAGYADYTKVPLDTTVSSEGSKLSLSENQVVIGAGVSMVKVSAVMGWSTGITTGDKLAMSIGLNESGVNYVIIPGAAYVNIPMPSMMLEVEEDNTIELVGQDLARTGAIIRNGALNTWLMVEVIK
jgi:hypothetical protein